MWQDVRPRWTAKVCAHSLEAMTTSIIIHDDDKQSQHGQVQWCCNVRQPTTVCVCAWGLLSNSPPNVLQLATLKHPGTPESYDDRGMCVRLQLSLIPSPQRPRSADIIPSWSLLRLYIARAR